MNDFRPLTVGGEFDGIGLLAYGLHLAGLEHAWLCEVDPWRRSILELRFPGVPVFDDVRTVGAANAVPVDVIAGGFPCKGVSPAGKQNGFEHPETVLWREMLRTVRELRPRYVLVENVANILGAGGKRRPDRCLCGWPYRWRGLHLCEQAGLRPDGYGDVRSGAAAAGEPSGRVRRDGEHDPSRDGEMGDGVCVGAPRDAGGRASARGAPGADDQAAAGHDRDRSRGTAAIANPPRKTDGTLDRRGARRDQEDAGADIRLEPEGAEDGCCPACGRPVEEAVVEPRGTIWREVLGGLSALGFDVVWDCLPAATVGAPHRRDRVFAVAWHPDQPPADAFAATGRPRGAVGQRSGEDVAHPAGPDQRRRGGELGEPGGRPDAGGDRQAVADADRRGCEIGAQLDGEPFGPSQQAPLGHDSDRPRPRMERRVAVEWGDFEPAIRRWESIHGPAPEPLVRRVDDGSTRRVERSRLSALGDGVCVQVGLLAGRHILDLERVRVMNLDTAQMPEKAA